MKYTKLSTCLLITIIFLGVAKMDALGFLGFGGSTSWKEEVLLHDGKKIVVERSQYRGGNHEMGQEVPVAEHTISFAVPDTEKQIAWSSKYGLNDDRLILLAVDVVNGIPYIATTPTTCIAYNKWERPNPPYVFFKYDGTTWQRIPLEQFPAETKEANVVISALMSVFERRLTKNSKPVSAEAIKKINAEARDPSVLYLHTFSRKPLTVKETAKVGCSVEVPDGHGGWLGIDWFTSQPSHEACIQFCKRKKITNQYCPCDSIFKENGR